MYKNNKSTDLILKIKPEFNLLIIIFRILPFQIFATIWMTGASKIMGTLILNTFITPLTLSVIVGILTFTIFSIIATFRYKNMYLKTEYRIYSNRIEYTEGFWTIEEKTLLFKNVTETNLKIGIFQGKAKIGTVLLVTPTITRNNRYEKQGGLYIKDIKDPKMVYNKLSELMV